MVNTLTLNYSIDTKAIPKAYDLFVFVVYNIMFLIIWKRQRLGHRTSHGNVLKLTTVPILSVQEELSVELVVKTIHSIHSPISKQLTKQPLAYIMLLLLQHTPLVTTTYTSSSKHGLVHQLHPLRGLPILRGYLLLPSQLRIELIFILSMSPTFSTQ